MKRGVAAIPTSAIVQRGQEQVGRDVGDPRQRIVANHVS